MNLLNIYMSILGLSVPLLTQHFSADVENITLFESFQANVDPHNRFERFLASTVLVFAVFELVILILSLVLCMSELNAVINVCIVS